MTRLISFLAHAVYMGTPLLFGTVGEIQNEKAGHLNLGVEGTMAMGACAGFMVAYKTGSLWLSILAAFLMGALVSLIYAFLTITMMAEPKRNRSYTDYIRYGTFKLHRRADDICFTYRQPQTA